MIKLLKNKPWWSNESFYRPSVWGFDNWKSTYSSTWIEKNCVIDWYKPYYGRVTLDTENEFFQYMEIPEKGYFFLEPLATKNKTFSRVTYEVIPDLWVNNIMNLTIEGHLALTSNTKIKHLDYRGIPKDVVEYYHPTIEPLTPPNPGDSFTVNFNGTYLKDVYSGVMPIFYVREGYPVESPVIHTATFAKGRGFPDTVAQVDLNLRWNTYQDNGKESGLMHSWNLIPDVIYKSLEFKNGYGYELILDPLTRLPLKSEKRWFSPKKIPGLTREIPIKVKSPKDLNISGLLYGMPLSYTENLQYYWYDSWIWNDGWATFTTPERNQNAITLSTLNFTHYPYGTENYYRNLNLGTVQAPNLWTSTIDELFPNVVLKESTVNGVIERKDFVTWKFNTAGDRILTCGVLNNENKSEGQTFQLNNFEITPHEPVQVFSRLNSLNGIVTSNATIYASQRDNSEYERAETPQAGRYVKIPGLYNPQVTGLARNKDFMVYTIDSETSHHFVALEVDSTNQNDQRELIFPTPRMNSIPFAKFTLEVTDEVDYEVLCVDGTRIPLNYGVNTLYFKHLTAYDTIITTNENPSKTLLILNVVGNDTNQWYYIEQPLGTDLNELQLKYNQLQTSKEGLVLSNQLQRKELEHQQTMAQAQLFGNVIGTVANLGLGLASAFGEGNPFGIVQGVSNGISNGISLAQSVKEYNYQNSIRPARLELLKNELTNGLNQYELQKLALGKELSINGWTWQILTNQLPSYGFIVFKRTPSANALDAFENYKFNFGIPTNPQTPFGKYTFDNNRKKDEYIYMFDKIEPWSFPEKSTIPRDILENMLKVPFCVTDVNEPDPYDE